MKRAKQADLSSISGVIAAFRDRKAKNATSTAMHFSWNNGLASGMQYPGSLARRLYDFMGFTNPENPSEAELRSMEKALWENWGIFMSHKFTPGPWLHVQNGLSAPFHVYRKNDSSEIPVPVCTIIADDREGVDPNANARLIAAAPELLSGLMEAVNQLVSDYRPTHLDGRRALIEKLEAIVAKAGGK